MTTPSQHAKEEAVRRVNAYARTVKWSASEVTSYRPSLYELALSIDREHGVQIALLAIADTTERCAQVAESYPSTEYADIPIIRGIAQAIRNMDRSQPND